TMSCSRFRLSELSIGSLFAKSLSGVVMVVRIAAVAPFSGYRSGDAADFSHATPQSNAAATGPP
ncbi:MAG: hypothetical protein ACREIV_13655, partial [Planctomycetaceae bacterium]